jgi:hypothetical protein
MSNEWFLKAGCQIVGPLSFNTLQERAREGHVAGDDKVRCGIDGPWAFADSVPRLMPRQTRVLPDSSSLSPHAKPPDAPADETDETEWYYSLGGRTHGPTRLEVIRELVSCSADLVADVVVRKGRQGNWTPYRTLDPEANRGRLELAADSALGCSGATTKQLSSSRQSDAIGTTLRSGRTWGERVRSQWDILLIGVVWLVFNSILVGDWYFANKADLRYFRALAAAADKARDARVRNLSAADRARLAVEVQRDVQPIVDDLRRSASVDRPIRQHLLWAARDHLGKLFSESAGVAQRGDRAFQEHMYEAGRELGIDVRPPPRSTVDH